MESGGGRVSSTFYNMDEAKKVIQEKEASSQIYVSCDFICMNWSNSQEEGGLKRSWS